MVAALLLALVVAGAARAAVPEPIPGVPAVRSHREQECPHLRAPGSPGSAAPRLRVETPPGAAAEGAAAAPGKGKRCSLCTRVLGKIKALADTDPNEARGKGCRALGKHLGHVCKWLLKKFWKQIRKALQDGQEPRDICATIGFCKA